MVNEELEREMLLHAASVLRNAREEFSVTRDEDPKEVSALWMAALMQEAAQLCMAPTEAQTALNRSLLLTLCAQSFDAAWAFHQPPVLDLSDNDIN